MVQEIFELFVKDHLIGIANVWIFVDLRDGLFVYRVGGYRLGIDHSGC